MNEILKVRHEEGKKNRLLDEKGSERKKEGSREKVSDTSSVFAMISTVERN